jgi:hypothetical protein
MFISLRLLVEMTKTKQDKYPKLFKFLTEHPGPTIIYVTLQKVRGRSFLIINRHMLTCHSNAAIRAPGRGLTRPRI